MCPVPSLVLLLVVVLVQTSRLAVYAKHYSDVLFIQQMDSVDHTAETLQLWPDHRPFIFALLSVHITGEQGEMV